MRLPELRYKDVQSAQDRVMQVAHVSSDISEHLVGLFLHAVLHTDIRCGPFVELGVRRGNSTKALWEAAKVRGVDLISVDINDNSGVIKDSGWTFVRSDSVQFGKRYPEWCSQRGRLLAPISLLFIDTSHLYEMTRREIRAWLPHLSANGTMVFHDTNQLNGNEGVPHALEDFLGIPFRRMRHLPFSMYAAGWHIRHLPHCDGMTFLRREVWREGPLKWREYMKEK